MADTPPSDNPARPVRVGVYSIALNESANVADWAKSAADADCTLLVDTGSTDDTVELAAGLGLQVAAISLRPFRFDDGFNAALALLPAELDVAVCLHLDERLEPGWRPEIEAGWAAGGRQFTFEYQWSPALSFRHDRIHARHGYRWLYPAHEALSGAGKVVDTAISVTQTRDESKDRGQDRSLIELGWQENPDRARPTYYWARELFYAARWEESRALFMAYLSMPDANYDEERSEACRHMASMVFTDQQEAWLLRSAAEAPQRREPWADLAYWHATHESPEHAAGFARRALSISARPDNSYHRDAGSWDDAALSQIVHPVNGDD